MHRLFVEQSLVVDGLVRLRSERAHYLCTVLRCRGGERLRLFDGSGGEYSATLESCSRREAILKVGAYLDKDTRSPLAITLAVAVARGERMDWAVQKAVELGVCAIQPLISARCTVRLDQRRAAQRHAHWWKIMIAACEQSGRVDVPDLMPVTDLDVWLSGHRAGIMLSPLAEQGLGRQAPAAGEVELLIGPEGGLGPDEEALASQAGLLPVRLGPRVLRNETAVAAGITALQFLWGDMN